MSKDQDCSVFIPDGSYCVGLYNQYNKIQAEKFDVGDSFIFLIDDHRRWEKEVFFEKLNAHIKNLARVKFQFVVRDFNFPLPGPKEKDLQFTIRLSNGLSKAAKNTPA